MLICSQCKKTFQQQSRYCSNCGSPLTELPEDAAYPSAPQADGVAGKKGAGAIVGMFLVNCVPILGFPVAFLWAQVKMKRAKGKLVAVTAVFLVLNIAVTILAYTLTINLMKNSLEKAAKSAMTAEQAGGKNKLPGIQENAPATQAQIPGVGDTIPQQDIPGLGSGMLEQLIPGFSGMQGEDGYDPGNYQLPEGVAMPEIDEDGNMHVDVDGDGTVDMVIDSKGNIQSSNVQIPSVDIDGNVYIDQDGDGENDITVGSSGDISQSHGNRLPEMDGDGNMYLDTDGDGEYDSYMDSSGMIIPTDDRTKTDAKGNRYIDYDRDGRFEYMVDTEGVVHFDADGDGKYETSFEQSWGQGELSLP